ncbi:glycosyltransferase involved in cell wall biosynthesis [Lewinella aquimaris]|uniref:Glycosyltransferase involved in cell wall biosynthesis n=1 Tax=Neolewinella aquimaris TaxID=1835722 RepID=A0A840E7U6_9BACT|nr:glycosyltransferase [Neolewinella aquimaris]MBB4079347.1 glycosyltransferase involved in cell wall biosynthesis [Neolewinella aquimaris]
MTVSIIIPTLNAEPFIERSLQSALRAGAQVQGEWEIIAVDNGSKDNTIALLERAAINHPNRITITHCAQRGAAAARNAGAKASTGEWLQFLDADDTLAPDKIRRQLASAGDAEWVAGAYRHLYPDGSTEDSIPHPDLWRGLFHDFRTGCTHSNLLRRDAFNAVGGWNDKLPSNQDPDLWFRLLRAGTSFIIDPVVGSYYHHHAGVRITGSDPSGSAQRRVQMLAAANAHLIEAQPEYWNEHAPYFLGALLRAVRMLATYDLDSATQAYRAYFAAPNEWAIDRPYELVGRYTRLYPYLGFRNLERLRLALADWLPETLKRRLKA